MINVHAELSVFSISAREQLTASYTDSYYNIINALTMNMYSTSSSGSVVHEDGGNSRRCKLVEQDVAGRNGEKRRESSVTKKVPLKVKRNIIKLW